MCAAASHSMKIVIETSGGVVQTVHTSEPGVIVDLLDWDDVNNGEKITAEEESQLLSEATAETPHLATWAVDAPDSPNR